MTIEELEQEMKDEYRQWESLAHVDSSVTRQELINLMLSLAKRFAREELEKLKAAWATGDPDVPFTYDNIDQAIKNLS